MDIGDLLKKNPQIAELFGAVREPNYRYFQVKNVRFCWTTEKIEHNGKKRFVAFIRRELLSKKRKNTRYFKTGKKVYFARRKKAKARALKWYENYLKRTEKIIS
jgi:hypothetical protein